jgi:hypothetical protein
MSFKNPKKKNLWESDLKNGEVRELGPFFVPRD